MIRSVATSSRRHPVLAVLLVLVVTAGAVTVLGGIASAATITVNSGGDDGDFDDTDGVCETALGNGVCTFRAALQEANADAVADEILFNIPADAGNGYDGGTGRWTLSPTSAYPAITNPVTISGASQPNPDTVTGPRVVLDGSDPLLVTGDGLTVDATATTVTVSDVAVTGFPGNGLTIAGADVVVTGVHVGVAGDGATVAGNGALGIEVTSTASNVTLGGATAGAGLVVGGNAVGQLSLDGSGHVVLGSAVGVDAAGTTAFGATGPGVTVAGGHHTIGGTAAGEGNHIAGNGATGTAAEVAVVGGSADLLGNTIGVAADGTTALTSAARAVHVTATATGTTTVGGSAAGAGNTLGGVSDSAVRIEDGPTVNVLGNRILSTPATPIDLDSGVTPGNVTPNDPLDADAGANGLLNFPVLTSATPTAIDVELDVPAGSYRLEVFRNLSAGVNGHGPAEELLGAAELTHAGGGRATQTVTTIAGIADGDVLSATLTACDAPGCATFLGTSEVSTRATVVTPYTLSGTVLEDLDGDGDVSDGAPIGGVGVTVLLDDGDGVPEPGDPVVGRTTTDGAGLWRVTSTAPGTQRHWVVVDSTSATPAALTAGSTSGDVVAEQTWAAAGAVSADGGWSIDGAAGPQLGGARLTGTDAPYDPSRAEHLLAVTTSGADVTGLDLAFSFVAVTHASDGTRTDPLTDGAARTAFDVDAALGSIGARGYVGGVHVGDAVHLVPGENLAASHGTVLRWDTSQAVDTAGAWSAFDTTSLSALARGYAGAAFDGRYVTYAPGLRDGVTAHGVLARHDTAGAFASAGSWEVVDLATLLDPSAVGFGDVVVTSTHVVLPPGPGSSVAVRSPIGSDVGDAGSWELVDLAAAGVLGDLPGVTGPGASDGRYLYWASADTTSGEMLRLDTRGDFTDASAWTTYDPVADGIGRAGASGVVASADALYVLPAADTSGAHGNVRRLDLAGAFDDPAAWSSFDAGLADGVGGGTFDGRWLWLAPGQAAGAPHGTLVRHDTAGAFGAATSWASVDVSADGTDTQGFGGAVLVGTDVLLVPGESDPGVASGEVLLVESSPTTAQGTLRGALANADHTDGAQTLAPQLSGTDPAYDGTAWTVTLASTLAASTPVVLDATAQAGWVDTPVVHLDGALLPVGDDAADDALRLTGGATVRGLSITAAPDDGLVLGGSSITVTGVDLGVSPTGTVVGNGGSGLVLEGPADTVAIGGTGATEGVTVVGSGANGIETVGTVADATIVGVRLGRLPDGTGAGNAAHGLLVSGDGGAMSVTASTIADNGGAGVAVTGLSDVAITGNVIVGNGGLGIDLGADGVTVNDPGDGDTGPNGLLNLPLVHGVTTDDVGAVTATIRLDVPAGDVRIEVFTNPSGLDPDAGEAERLIAVRTATSPGAPVDVTVPLNDVTLGDELTATVTSVPGGVPRATSEVSDGVTVTDVTNIGLTPVFRDASRQDEDGRPQGGMDSADRVTGRIGPGISLDGLDDRVSLWGPGQAGTALTVSAWVRPTGDGTIAARGDSGAEQWRLERSGGALRAHVDLGGGAVTITGGALPASTWHHVALVIDGGAARLYLAGVEQGSATVAGTLTRDVTTRTWIGARGDLGLSGPLQGTVDEFRVASTARSAAWIALEAANGTNPESLTRTLDVQVLGDPVWEVDGTTARTGTRSLTGPEAVRTAWLTLDGVDEAGLELSAWWLVDGSPQDIGTGVVAEPGGAGPVQDEVTLHGDAGWALSRWDAVSTSLVPPPAGQRVPTDWERVTVRSDQLGRLSSSVGGVELGPTAGPGVRGSGTVGFRVDLLTLGQRWWVDDLLLRRFVAPEPTTRLGPLQPVP